MQKPVVSVVIGTYCRFEYLQKAIKTVRAELEKVPGEIIVVDGGSDDGTIEWLVQQKDIVTIVQHNRGEWRGKSVERRSWGYFMNLGFKAAQGTYICMLSDDCLVIPGAIEAGVKCFTKQSKGARTVAVAFYWRNWPEQEKYWVGLTFGNNVFVNHGLYLREALAAIGYADEDNYFFYHADGDICLRLIKAGYSVAPCEDAYVEHRSDANVPVRESNLERQKKDWQTYQSTWEGLGLPKQDWIERSFTDNHHTAEKYWVANNKKGLLRRLGR